ncbi:hypothetical protein [Deinococcus peraridilitoris]|uniref:Uncharacterized protein n=1 Tax=Deinococcus peraridilitoris (strain DSM 19664 / LMG 22246 / CIP 109416 / KR-200) TaxID=937777 RepID=K9ZZU8_DEIPD|nr:hypothetical protein [Deinococcus peraridilitoris]AFZ67106.1 hypothetical protein Deipe_1565 [Deinococcus peraridilitoris DSM 19664]
MHELIRKHLKRIEAASNRMIGAALVKDMLVITEAGHEISASCEAIDILLDGEAPDVELDCGA